MFTFYLLLPISVLSSVLCTNETEPNYVVLTLDQDNINNTIKNNEYIFISFYASWCKYSILAAPEFQKAAKKASELKLPVTLAQIESTGKKKMFDIPGFPTYKLFQRGVPTEYLGQRTSENFIQWLQDHLKPITTLNTTEEAKNFIESENIVIIGFFKNDQSEKAKMYKTIRNHFGTPVFALASNEDVFNAYNATPDSIVLFRKFDEEDEREEVLFTDALTLDNVKSFLKIESQPLLNDLNEGSINDIVEKFTNNHKYVFVVVSKSDNNKTNPFLQSARHIAKEYRNKMTFVIVDVDKQYLAPLTTLFYLAPDEIPGLVLIPNIFKSGSYKMSGNLSIKNMKTFLQYFENDKFDDLLSEKLPIDWNQTPVYTLVKENYLNVTHDVEKNVLVYLYVDNCSQCLQWENIIEDLGKTFADREDVIVSKLNIGLNSIDDKWYVTGIPTIVLFQKGDNHDIVYNGKADLNAMIEFVESGGVNRTTNENKVNM